jgi:hypothetical protein
VRSDSDKVDKIIADVAMENSLKSSTVKDVYEKAWKAIRFFVGSSTLPRVIVRNFGTFEPYTGSIEHQLKKIELQKSEGKNIKDSEKEERFERTKERISRESETRRYSKRKEERLQASSGNLGDVQSVSGEHSDSSRNSIRQDRRDQEERQEGDQ